MKKQNKLFNAIEKKKKEQKFSGIENLEKKVIKERTKELKKRYEELLKRKDGAMYDLLSLIKSGSIFTRILKGLMTYKGNELKSSEQSIEFAFNFIKKYIKNKSDFENMHMIIEKEFIRHMFIVLDVRNTYNWYKDKIEKPELLEYKNGGR